jgi:hypothetical protein
MNRAQRRAAERKANNISAAAAPAPLPFEPETVPVSPAPQIELPQPSHPTTSQAQIDANRANSQLSTGPRTAAGKAISSQNRTYHGLAGDFQLMPWEDVDRFLTLQNDLRAEYQPSTLTEQSYVDRLAEHMWCRQRCLDLIPLCHDFETHLIDEPRQFALLQRYQTANERGMDKCVNLLLKLRATQRKEEIGFESQKRQEAAETRKIEAHEARMHLANARAKRIEVDSTIRQTVQAPLPGHMRIPFEELGGMFRAAISDVSQKLAEKQAAA